MPDKTQDGSIPVINRKVTRKDIARQLGVSVSVVSRALNNSGYVNKEAKEKILALAEELHYTPNPVAMTLQQRKTRQIMFVCKDLHNSFNIDLYYGMLKVAEERGYMLLLNGKLDFTLLRETLVDGIILSNDYAAYDYDRRCGKNYYLPAVMAGFGNRFPMQKAIPVVEWNLYEGMEKAIGYLRKHGHKKIALACSDVFLAADPRTVAWISMMRDELGKDLARYHLGINSHDLDVMPGTKVPDSSTTGSAVNTIQAIGTVEALGTVTERALKQEEENFFEHGRLAARLFLDRKLDATALICFNDELGFGVLSGLQKAGIRVPEDISLISFDGCYRIPQTSPRLTTVTGRPEHMGARLAGQLIDMIEGRPYHYVERMPIKILEGESVGQAGKL
ncbi:MAG: LacI family DNA-binding transcriptional regulator [Blautia sp.]|nr:LacI family DNA-binding transcriptional regulator [Blautia sp.]